MIAVKHTTGTEGTTRARVLRLACLRCVLGLLGVLCANPLSAQQGGFAMPDPKQMAGIPRPVTDLPDGAVSVRLIRGQLSNNIAGHPVELHAGGKTTTVKTDENGRAEFKGLGGTTVKFSADVDGEHLESREFLAPGTGGIRLMLVATDSTKKNAPAPAAQTGAVVIGEQSRFVLQPREEGIELFYLLDIANNQSMPVNPASPFVFDLPEGASGTGIMDGSSPQASVKGTRVTVEGPFAPGHTFVQVATALPALDGSIDIAQRLPANLVQLAVIVKKVGADTTLKSPQLREQREMPADGDTFIAGTGGPVNAGQPIQLTIGGIPHHSQAPRRIALALAALVVAVGAWFATRSTGDHEERATERKRLIARREKLFAELARLEQDRRGGRVDDRRYAPRREELIASLEAIYNALESHEAEPIAAGRAGATA